MRNLEADQDPKNRLQGRKIILEFQMKDMKDPLLLVSMRKSHDHTIKLNQMLIINIAESWMTSVGCILSKTTSSQTAEEQGPSLKRMNKSLST